MNHQNDPELSSVDDATDSGSLSSPSTFGASFDGRGSSRPFVIPRSFSQAREAFQNLPKPAQAAVAASAAFLLAIGLMKGGALLGLVGSNQKLSVGQPETDPEELAKRSTLQDSILTDADGKQKKLSDYRGSVVIVGFWATWSAPCLLELSTFGELANKYSSQGLKVIAVNIDEGEEGKAFARSFWEKKSLRIDSFFDAQKALAHQFDVEMLPSAFVLDRQGRLAFSGFGSNDWFSPMTVEFLEGLLAESADRSGADSADQSDSQSANPADGPSN